MGFTSWTTAVRCVSHAFQSSPGATVSTDRSPCRMAFIFAALIPSFVFGPVDSRAFRLFASSCLSLVMSYYSFTRRPHDVRNSPFSPLEYKMAGTSGDSGGVLVGRAEDVSGKGGLVVAKARTHAQAIRLVNGEKSPKKRGVVHSRARPSEISRTRTGQLSPSLAKTPCAHRVTDSRGKSAGRRTWSGGQL
jgi:hypothetical protein